MENSKFFIFVLCLCVSQLIALPLSKPLLGGSFCSGKLSFSFFVAENETKPKKLNTYPDVALLSKQEKICSTTNQLKNMCMHTKPRLNYG